MNIITLLIPILPLLGFLFIGLNTKLLKNNTAGIIASSTVFISFVFSLLLFFRQLDQNTSYIVTLFDWISVGKLNIQFSFLIDSLSVLMLLIVTGIGFLIHVYSIGYMHNDDGFNRFFAYMNLFIFSMLILVLADNYLVLFVGWEGVGLCSYLLIGFWFKNHEFNNAAKKAFIINRIGDLGFLLAMFLIFITFGTLNFQSVFLLVNSMEITHITIVTITLLLFIGAVGKSTQIPLFTWLPDAMAGPTPVSALIHAATMVTAGIYMVVRSHVLYLMATETMLIISVVGLATAILAGTIALYQTDIKKVLAYSTVSQLGYMFLGVGVGAFTGAMFHLTTHAFFKALLFLGAGSIIHALHGEQDIRNMGGLQKALPKTYITFLIATIAISGIPPFAGFFSKDEIFAHVFAHNQILWAFAVLGSLLTAFYMFRLFYLVFKTKFRGTENQQKHLHESPNVMTIPLIILSILSIFGGFIGIPQVLGLQHVLSNFLSPVFANSPATVELSLSHTTEILLMLFTVIFILIIIYFAYQQYIVKQVVPNVQQIQKSTLKNILYRKYYFDEIYSFIIEKPIQKLSDFFHQVVDNKLIDGLVNSIGNVTVNSSSVLRYLQTGNIGFYLYIMVLSIVAIISFSILL